jgi:enoyl-CoA hydratase/carnithine racemase
VPFPAIALEIMRGVLPARHLAEMIYGGRTLGVEDALARGLVDAAIEPGALLDAAVAEAEALAAIPAASFTLTKAQLRQPTRDFLARHAARIDDEALACWSAPPAQAAIRRYVEKTLAGGRR